MPDCALSPGVRRRLSPKGKKIILSEEISGFLVWVEDQNFSLAHHAKLRQYAIKLSKSVYNFNVKELLNIKGEFCNEGFFKVVRSLCNYFEETYSEDLELQDMLTRVRKIAKKPSCIPDIYTPTDEEMEKSLNSLKEKDSRLYRLYLGLMCSGVRIIEMLELLNTPENFRIIQKEGFKKVIFNKRRNTKTCLFIYLPDWFDLTKVYLTQGMVNKFLTHNKDIVRAKYTRNWFYSKCLDLGIPSGIADFYQGRSPVTMGDKHYLDKEKMADREYHKLIGIIKD